MFGSSSKFSLVPRLGVSILLLISLSWLSLNTAWAAQPDVRLVVDISGSMKRTDPNNLRISATNLLIDLLPKDSRASIWTFGAYVNRLVDTAPTTDSWRQKARQEAQKINSVAMFTDIENAIERAAWDYKNPDPKRDVHLVLISDGLVDISEAATAAKREAENLESRDTLLRELTPKLAQAGYTIHTLALSDEADHDLMATLAQRTGGLHAIAHEAEDLMPLLLQIINRLAPSAEVPLENNRFLIDKTIDEFTLLVFHGAGSQARLHSPEGEIFTAQSAAPNQKWHGNNSYSLITVEEPQAGRWSIETPEHKDNRVTIISDISFNTNSLPSTLYRGYPVDLEAWFTENKQLIDKREFLKILQVSAKHNKSGHQLSKFDLPLDSKRPYFTAKFDDFSHLGEQNLVIEVDGRTFSRQVNHSFNVQDVIAASLQLPDDGSSPRVILRSQHPDIKPAQVRFLIDANSKPLSADYRGDGEWKVDLSSLNRRQEQRINILVQTQKDGQDLSIELPSLTLKAAAQSSDNAHSLDSNQEASSSQASAQAESSSGSGALINPITQLPVPIIPATESATETQPEEDLETTPSSTASSTTSSSTTTSPATEETSASSSLPLVGSIFDGIFEPIHSWDDPRMPWIYIGLGVANILLFLVAFMMYRSFINKRKAKNSRKKEPEALEDLEGSMEDLLDEFGDEFDDETQKTS